MGYAPRILVLAALLLPLLLMLPLLLLTAGCTRVAIPPATPGGQAASPLYRVWIDGREVPVLPLTVGTITDGEGRLLAERPETVAPAPAALAIADVDGPAEVEVEVLAAAGHRPLRSAVVRPARQGIAARCDGDRIRFRIAGPAKLSVEPNGALAAPLLLAIGGDTAPGPRPGDPGVTHYFGPGVHRVGVLELPSHSRVYLAPGAVVQGHLVCSRVEDVRIWGRGVLDSSRSPGLRDGVAANPFGAYRVALGLYWSRRIAVEGIAILDSPNWSVQAMHSQDLRLAGLTVVSWRENGDGIDLASCERAEIAGCLVRTWDDSLCVKAVRGDPVTGGRKSPLAEWTPADAAVYRAYPARDIAFRDCVVWNDRAHALEIGFETAGTAIEDITWERIDIIHDLHLAAIDITVGDAAPVRRILYRDIRIEDPRSAELVHLATGPCYVSVDPRLGLPFGAIEAVRFEDLRVLAPQAPPSSFTVNGAPIRAVSFAGVVVGGRPMASAAALDVRCSPGVDLPGFPP